MLWRDTDKASMISLSQNNIDVEMRTNESGTWRLTGLYGEPDCSKCRKTWDLL